jgi:hypothetical protein
MVFLLMSCSNNNVLSKKLPQDTCVSNRSPYSLYIIDKNKYTKIETINGTKQSRPLTLQEFEAVAKTDIKMLVSDKVYLINDIKALELENQCLRQFI